jgi:hypothetical protein
VKINIGKQRTDTSALNRTFFTSSQPALFQHTRPQPFLDKVCDAPVSYPMLNKLYQPFMPEGIEKCTNIRIKHPVHFLSHNSDIKCIQSMMRTASLTKPLGKSKKILFVNCIHHLRCRTLNDLVFQY